MNLIKSIRGNKVVFKIIGGYYMQKDLVLLGKVKIGNFEFEGIEGGFGIDKRAILVRDVARIHNKKIYHINELINSNRDKFKDGIDIIDLLGIGLSDTEIINLGVTQQAINSYRGKGKGLYILSDRGYMKLVKLLEDETAWKIYDIIIDEYFTMKKELREINGRRLPSNYLEALEELLIECKKTEKLESKIREYKPKVEFYDTLIELKDVLDMKKSAKILNFYNLGRNRLYEILRWNKVLMKNNEPYQSYFERGWFTIKESIINDRVVVTTYVTNKGLEGIRNN
jgi:hypothetical protein